jgi:uncharacterized SAM-binding protein YcdF (DUF218 family)
VLFWLKKFVGFWLMPLPFCLGAMVLGAVLLLLTSRRTLGRVLLSGGLLLLLLFSNHFVSRLLIRPIETRFAPIPDLTAGAPLPPRLAGCTHVVVLGAGNGYDVGVAANSLLSGAAIARITEAVRLLRVLPQASLIVSGPGVGDRESHASLLARTAVSLGIPRERITLIDSARDTEEESEAVQRIVGGGRVALITSAWHMPRSVALFRHLGLDVVPCPTDFRSHAEDTFHFDDLFWELGALEASTLAVRERIGTLWITLRGRAAEEKLPNPPIRN